MFDIGFWELCLITVVALLVFGPEKLPGAARSAGLWVGRARRLVATVKQEVDRELHLQEARDAIKQGEQSSLHQFLEETKTHLEDTKTSLTDLPKSLRSSVESTTDLPSNNTPSSTQPTEQR